MNFMIAFVGIVIVIVAALVWPSIQEGRKRKQRHAEYREARQHNHQRMARRRP